MGEKVMFQNFFEPFLGIEGLSLSIRGRKLAWTVYSIAVREINKCVQNSKSNAQKQANKELVQENLGSLLEHDKNCSELKSELKNVLEIFQEVYKARDEFLDNFCAWNTSRFQLIDQLQDITSSIDYGVYNWDVCKIISRTLMIAGGIAVFGPITFPPMTLTTMPVAAGGLTGAAAILAWRQLNRFGIGENCSMVKVQHMRYKDLESLKHLDRWFESSEQLLKALTSLIGIHTLEVMMKDWKTFLHQSKDLNDEVWLGPMIKQWVRDVHSCWYLQLKFGTQFAPVVSTFIFVVLFLQEQNVSILECISRTRHVIINRPLVNDEKRENGDPVMMFKGHCPKFGKVYDDLRTIDLVTLTHRLREEGNFLESVYKILKLSVEEESSCFDALVLKKSTTQQRDKNFTKKVLDEPVTPDDLKKRSAVIIFNVPCNVEEDEVIDSAEALLPLDAKGTIKFLKIMPGLLGNHWVLEIDKDYLSLLKKQQNIKVGSSKCRIEKYFGIYRCVKCQRFGHNVANCKSELICSDCAGNHSVKHCTMQEQMCINCIRFNQNNDTDYNTNHAVDGRKCSTYNNLKEHLRSGKTFESWIKKAG